MANISRIYLIKSLYMFFERALNKDGSYQDDPESFRRSARMMLAQANDAGVPVALKLGLAYVLQHEEIPIETWADDVAPEEADARAALSLAFDELWPGEDWRAIDTSDVTFE